MDITDDVYDPEDVDKILLLVDNMPLAIDLIAHLVDSEGLLNVLARWETERTLILSEGHDTTSNLEFSISLSLSGPRMTSLPNAQDLLSLLSMLTDGLSDVELLQSDLPFDNILACKSALLRTALAYTDGQRRLRTLAPIREFMQRNHSPGDHLIQPLFKYYRELLDLYNRYHGTLPNAQVVDQIKSNVSNIHSVLLHGLKPDNPDLAQVVYGICDLNRYSRRAGHGTIPLLDQIAAFLPSPVDHRLEMHVVIQLLTGWTTQLVEDERISQGLRHLDHFDDPDLKCEFLR